MRFLHKWPLGLATAILFLYYFTAGRSAYASHDNKTTQYPAADTAEKGSSKVAVALPSAHANPTIDGQSLKSSNGLSKDITKLATPLDKNSTVQPSPTLANTSIGDKYKNPYPYEAEDDDAVVNLQQKNQTLQSALHELNEKYNTLAPQVQTLTLEKKEYEAVVSELKQIKEDLSNELIQIQSSMQSDIQMLHGSVYELQHTNQSLITQNDQLTRKINQAKQHAQTIQKLTTENTQLKQQNAHYQTALDASRKTEQLQKTRLQALKTQKQQAIADELQELYNTIEALEQENNALIYALDELELSTNQNRAKSPTPQESLLFSKQQTREALVNSRENSVNHNLYYALHKTPSSQSAISYTTKPNSDELQENSASSAIGPHQSSYEEYDALLAQIKTASDNIKQLTAEKELLNKECQQQKQQMAKLQKSINTLKNNNEQQVLHQKTLDEAINKHQNKIKNKQTAITDLQSTHKKAQKAWEIERQKLKASHDAIIKNLTDAHNTKENEWRTDRQTLNLLIGAKQGAIKSLKATISNQKKEITTLKQQAIIDKDLLEKYDKDHQTAMKKASTKHQEELNQKTAAYKQALQKEKEVYDKRIAQVETLYDQNIGDLKRENKAALQKQKVTHEQAVQKAENDHKKEVTDLKSQLETQKKQYEQQIKNSDTRFNKFDKVTKETYKKIKQQYDEKEAENKRLKRVATQAEAKAKKYQAQFLKFNTRLANQKELQDKSTKLNTAKQVLAAKIKQKDNELIQKEKARRQLAQLAQQRENRIKSLQNGNSTLKSQKKQAGSALRVNKGNAGKEIEQRKQNLQAKDNEINKLKTANSAQTVHHTQESTPLTPDYAQKQTALKAARAEIKTLKQTRKTLEGQITSLNQLLVGLACIGILGIAWYLYASGQTKPASPVPPTPKEEPSASPTAPAPSSAAPTATNKPPANTINPAPAAQQKPSVPMPKILGLLLLAVVLLLGLFGYIRRKRANAPAP